MEIERNLTCNALRKAALLITKADALGMDLSGYGHTAENGSSGNVYLWIEDYSFSLMIGPSGPDTIYALWSNPDDGEEEIINTRGMTLIDLETWAEELAEAREA